MVSLLRQDGSYLAPPPPFRKRSVCFGGVALGITPARADSRRVRQRVICLVAVGVLLAGCSAGDKHRLQAEIDGLLPDGARRAGECNWASGFTENAPASLACSYFVEGDVRSVANVARTKLRARGYKFRVVRLPKDAPTEWLVRGQHIDYYASVGVVAPGDPLNWQLNRLPVPPGDVGFYVQVAERE
jgi:hypothetical protein